MTDQERDELLALTNKASLNPQTDHRYTRLEGWLSATYLLSTYTPDEIVKLRAQLSSLSEDEQADLSTRVVQKTAPSRFHLSDDEVDKIKAGRKTLSFHERAELVAMRGLWAGTAWLDLGGVLDAQITLDDHSSLERQERPYAYIHFTDNVRDVYARQGDEPWPGAVVIDILESVRGNAVCIGHPVIIFAVHQWQRVIQAKRVLKRDRWIGEDAVEIAERNLKAIAKALIDAPETNALKDGQDLFVNVHRMRLDRSFLRKAHDLPTWEWLRSFYTDPRNETEDRKAQVAQHLIKGHCDPYYESYISAYSVAEFLESEKGQQYIIDDKDSGNSGRIRWVVFERAFIAHRYGIKQSTIGKYLRRGAKAGVDPKASYQPSFGLPHIDSGAVLIHALTRPLVTVEGIAIHTEEEEPNLTFEEATLCRTGASPDTKSA